MEKEMRDNYCQDINLNVNCPLIGDKKIVPGNLSPAWVIRRQKYGEKIYQ